MEIDMKILQVVPRLSKKYGGGGVVIATTLAKELGKKNHKALVLGSDYGWDVDERLRFHCPNVSHFELRTIFTVSTLHITDRPKLFLNWLFGETALDVIHMQGVRTFQNIIAYHYAKKYKIPYIVDSHGFAVAGSFLRRLLTKLFDIMFANKICRDANFCVAETKIGKDEFIRAGVKPEKIVIIPCGCDLGQFDNLPPKGGFRKKWRIGVSKKIVLYLGSIEYIKGLDFLIKSFTKLGGDDNVLVLVGETPNLSYLETLCDMVIKLGMDKGKVIFTGGLYGKDKLEALVDADVAVFPSRAEQGIPFAAIEAIMCNTPVIVSDGTGAAEDIRKMGSPFIPIKFGDTESFKIVLELMLYGSVKTNWLEIAQKYIRNNLSITEKVKDYEKLYARCINE